jgi:N-acetylglucosamine kinase-like BadF-type ATPase
MVSLAIDIGQTQARVRTLYDASSSSSSSSELEIDGFAYGSNLLDTIAYIVESSVERLGLDNVDSIAVGSTGLYGHVPAVDNVLSRLNRSVGANAVVIADDAVTAYLGARGDQDGVVVAAGTGIVGLGHGSTGAARVDGVGGMIGDEGSGWWIGRQGLIAAISASDGRVNSSAALLARLEERFGAVADFPALLAAANSPVAVVASFAKDVADIARENDDVSAQIWRKAGDHIGCVIGAAASRAGLDEHAEWTLIGRLSGATDLLMPGLNSRLAELLPYGTQVASTGEPLDGVSQLLKIDTTRYGSMVRASRINA